MQFCKCKIRFYLPIMKLKEGTLVTSGYGQERVTNDVSNFCGLQMVGCKWHKHNDGEIEVSLSSEIRGKDVLIINSTHQPHVNIISLMLLLNCVRTNNPASVTVFIPYMGYLRQHNSFGNMLLNTFFQNGANEIMLLDHHSRDRIYDQSRIEHLYSFDLYVEYLNELISDGIVNDFCFLAPDHGAIDMAGKYAKHYNVDLITSTKVRDLDGNILSVKIDNEIRHETVIIVDDIIDTGNTLFLVTQEVLKMEQDVSVYMFVTHPLLSKDPEYLLKFPQIKQIVVTNSVPFNYDNKKIHVLNIAKILK